MKIYCDIRITLNQLVKEIIITILLKESDVTITNISQSLLHIMAGKQLA